MNDSLADAENSAATVATKIARFLRATISYMGISVAVFIPGILTPLLICMPFKIAAPAVLMGCRMIIFVASSVCGIGVNRSGNLEGIRRPCVIVCNHQCLWETVYLQVLLHPLSTVLKRSLLRIPFFGWGLSILQPIAIDRSAPVQSLKQIKEKSIVRLQQGRNVLIFPEGTRKPVGQLGNYTRSAADIAKGANVPIIAIAHDSGKYWRNKKYNKKPGTVHMVISEPIVVGDRNTKEVMALIQAWTQQQLDNME